MSRTHRALGALSLALCCGLSLSCAPAVRRAPARTAPAVARPLHQGPLSDLISAAGLRWLVLVKPQQLFSDADLRQAILQIVSSRRFDAFAESSGVDLRTLPSALIAGFPYATLYLAELPPGVAAQARDHFSERLVVGSVSKHPHAALQRITGVIGQTPESMLTIDDRQLAVVVGDPTQARVIEAYALGRLRNSPTALHGAALSSVPDLLADNSVVLYAPGPFANEWQRAAGGLLQSTVAVAIAAHPAPHGKIATSVCLAGAWGDSANDAATRLSEAWTKLVQSSAGHLFGLEQNAQVTANPELLTLTVDLDLSAIVHGLRASVLSDINEILHLTNPAQDTANPATESATPP